MKSLIVLLIGAVLLVYAGYLVYQNRDSETLTVPFVSVVLGAGLLAILSASYVLRPQSFETSLPIYVVWNSKTLEPLPELADPFQLTVASRSRQALQLLKAQSPDVLSNKEYAHSEILYQDLLQYLIVAKLSDTYAANWRVRIDAFSKIIGGGSKYRRLLLEFTDVQKHFPRNRFFANNPLQIKRLCLPPDTLILVDPASSESKYLSSITLQNQFAQIEIRIHTPQWNSKMSHTLRPFLRDVPPDGDLWMAGLMVMKINWTLSGQRIGNPEMPAYREWASQLTNDLKSEFDFDEKVQRRIQRLEFGNISPFGETGKP